MSERWQWHGDYLKIGDPDWVAEATEPTASALSFGVFDGGMAVNTPRGRQRARSGDWLYLADNGDVWLVPQALSDVLGASRLSIGSRVRTKIETYGGSYVGSTTFHFNAGIEGEVVRLTKNSTGVTVDILSDGAVYISADAEAFEVIG